MPSRLLFPIDLAGVQAVDNIQQVKLDTFESITSHEIGGEGPNVKERLVIITFLSNPKFLRALRVSVVKSNS